MIPLTTALLLQYYFSKKLCTGVELKLEYISISETDISLSGCMSSGSMYDHIWNLQDQHGHHGWRPSSGHGSDDNDATKDESRIRIRIRNSEVWL